MKEEVPILNTLKNNGFSNIDIDQIVNYLETLDYDLMKTSYIGMINSKSVVFILLRHPIWEDSTTV